MSDQQLLDLAAESKKTDLQVLISAKEKAKRQVLDDPSPANLTAYNQATRMLDNFISGGSQVVFKNRKEVLKYLQGQGYKVGQTKLYSDRLLRTQPDGTVTEKDVERYVKLTGLKKKPDEDGPLLAQTRKIKELEAARLEEQVRELRHKREVAEGRWMLKSDLEMEIAARLVVLETGLRNTLQNEIGGWVHAEGMDPKKIPLLLEKINDALDEQFNEFAGMDKFQVIIENVETEEEINVS